MSIVLKLVLAGSKRVLRGQVHFWRMMREQHAEHGQFSVTSIDAASNARREDIRKAFAALKSKADGFITLSSPGPAPKGLQSTGNPSMNAATSITGAPVWSLPLLASDGMPLGVQLGCFPHEDAKATGHARWLLDSFLTQA